MNIDDVIGTQYALVGDLQSKLRDGSQFPDSENLQALSIAIAGLTELLKTKASILLASDNTESSCIEDFKERFRELEDRFYGKGQRPY